jgi:hypothetical protein
MISIAVGHDNAVAAIYGNTPNPWYRDDEWRRVTRAQRFETDRLASGTAKALQKLLLLSRCIWETPGFASWVDVRGKVRYFRRNFHTGSVDLIVIRFAWDTHGRISKHVIRQPPRGCARIFGIAGTITAHAFQICIFPGAVDSIHSKGWCWGDAVVVQGWSFCRSENQRIIGFVVVSLLCYLDGRDTYGCRNGSNGGYSRSDSYRGCGCPDSGGYTGQGTTGCPCSCRRSSRSGCRRRSPCCRRTPCLRSGLSRHLRKGRWIYAGRHSRCPSNISMHY